jgi:hypothetical protein
MDEGFVKRNCTFNVNKCVCEIESRNKKPKRQIKVSAEKYLVFDKGH